MLRLSGAYVLTLLENTEKGPTTESIGGTQRATVTWKKPQACLQEEEIQDFTVALFLLLTK